ncbi:hypothetical protein ACQ4LE_002054 [Meloidogyne hapla]
MDPWIHCNKCYSQPTPTSKFWFTSCGHILCEGCAEPPNEIQKRKQCILCHVDAGYMQINRNMRPDLMDLFKPPKVLVSEYLTRINTTIAFQSYQRGHLTKYKDEQYKKLLNQVNGQNSQMNNTHTRSPCNNSFAPASNSFMHKSFGGSIIHRPSPTFSGKNTKIQNRSESSTNSFVPSSVTYSHRLSATGSIFHRPSPIIAGKITKGHVLPPQRFKHRWCS